MILVSIEMAVQWRARAILPTYLSPWTIYGWNSSCDKPRPSTPCSMRSTTHEMVPKMMYVQQHTTTRSIKRQPTPLVDLDEQDHIIGLAHGEMGRSSLLDDDVI